MTIELRTETRSLPCSLTPDETVQRADELATTVQEIRNEEERQTDLKAQLKATMTELSSRQTRLAHIISRREEYRDIEVIVTISEDGGKVYEVRKETGELITERAPRDTERQMFLDDFDRRAEEEDDSRHQQPKK